MPIRSLNDGFDAIKQMKVGSLKIVQKPKFCSQVRGAPLIATVGMVHLFINLIRNNLSADFVSGAG